MPARSRPPNRPPSAQAAREQPAGLEAAALEVGLDGDLGAARLLALQRLAARQVERRLGEQRDGLGRSRAARARRRRARRGSRRWRARAPRRGAPTRSRGRAAAAPRRARRRARASPCARARPRRPAISSSGRSRASGGAAIRTSSGRRRLPPAASVSREARPTGSSASCAASRCSHRRQEAAACAAPASGAHVLRHGGHCRRPRRRAGRRCRRPAAGSGRRSCRRGGRPRRARRGPGSGAPRRAGRSRRRRGRRPCRGPGCRGRTRASRSSSAAPCDGRVISRQTTRPPGRTTRASSRRPPSGSGRLRRPKPIVAAAKELSANGIAVASPRTHWIVRGVLARLLAGRAAQHLGREVEAGHLAAATDDAGQLEREVAGAAAGVEHRGAAADAGLARGERAPAPVEPGRHDAVHQVVGPGDAVEHALDVGRIEAVADVHAAPQRRSRSCSTPSRSSALPATKSIASSSVSGCV